MEVNSMSLLKGEKACVASGFEGRVTYEGKPASGARIVRKFSWKDEKGETEETIADKDGRFSFPSHWSVFRRMLPVEVYARQSIFIYFKNQEYQVWGTGKMDRKEYSEFGGKKPENFHCELTDDEVRGIVLETEFVSTTCSWDQSEQI
jgi:hypothetical protein